VKVILKGIANKYFILLIKLLAFNGGENEESGNRGNNERQFYFSDRIIRINSI
jgi:hypothetical protein